MAAPKISYPQFSVERLFSFEPSGAFSNDKTYFVPTDDLFVLALLNSRVLWFIISNIAPAVRGGFHELRVQYMETLPIPTVTAQSRRKLVTLASQSQETAALRLAKQREVTRRIPDLRPKGNSAELTTRLREWWKLADFAAFQAEIKKIYKTDIPLRERGGWDDWLSECRRVVDECSEQLHQFEQEIDAMVYEAFALSCDEVRLIEAASKTALNSASENL